MSNLSFINVLGKALLEPTEQNLARATQAMQAKDAELERQLLKMEQATTKAEEAEGKRPDPVALTDPAPAILESKGRTPEGSKTSRLNAVKHGILSGVIPDFEKEAYTLHVSSVFEDYNPQGYLENRLCERIASSLWRLQRLERHETAIVARDTAQAVKRLREKSVFSDWDGAAEFVERDADHAQDALEQAREALEFMRGGLENARGQNGDVISTWLCAFTDMAQRGTSIYQKADDKLDRALVKLGCEDGYTEAGELLTFELAHPLVTASHRSPFYQRKAPSVLEDWQGYITVLEERVSYLERVLEPVNASQPHTQALASVPHESNTDKIAKYEAHLERGLYKALHELEALQDKRNGKAAPLARLEVHGQD
jgi:hypothetical protein